MGRTKGIVAAVLAYTAWGPLAPLGALLLGQTGPFTLNVLRTAGSLVLFTLVMGPRTVLRSLRILGRDVRVWLLGVIGLGFTFGAYLTSLLYLEPTIAALLIYLSPIFVSWIARRRLGERIGRLFWPTLGLTILGGGLAILEPSRGVALPNDVLFGLFLGLLGVVGWTFYTVYLKHLGASYSDNELTFTSFVASGLAFLVVAVPFEGFRVDFDATFAWRLGFYIVFPSFLSFQLYAVAIRRAGAAFTSVLLGIELAATAVFSHFLTDETFGLEKAVGIGVVLLAVTGFLAGESGRSLETTPGKPPRAEGREDGEGGAG